ncbi:MAG TPA: FKBP-type peptidyl-prolyl cis-trans isomerase [Polyangiaceae bacterium]|nr:FKBP-type peptidyl-prolyl cis-trans isomerase [Polyangiaceae bacterium]
MPRQIANKQKGSAGFQAGPGMVVTLKYRLFDAEGELVEESPEGEIFTLLLGYAQAAPVLEAALSGARAGQSKRLKLNPAQAFGPRDAAGILELERNELPPEIAVGDEFAAEDAEGRLVPFKVVDLDEERVVVDTNHPLAGQQVLLELSLEAVRPATELEQSEAAQRLERLSGDAPAKLLPLASLLRHLPGTANSGTSTPDNRPRGTDGDLRGRENDEHS